MEHAPAGSRWGPRLVAAVSIAVIVLVAATLFLVAGTGTAAVVLTGAAVLVAVLALVVAHSATVAARLDAVLEFANHATVPAVVSIGPPSLGHVRERGRQPLPAGATLPVRLTHQVPAAEIEEALRACADHRYGWSVTVPATIENLAGTVLDDVRLTFALAPFLRSARGTWTWTDATAEHDGGYGRLQQRTYRPDAVSA